MKLLLSLLALLSTLAVPASAMDKPYEEFGDYKVYFTVFSSTFIKPEVAQAYNLVRDKGRVLVNVSVVKGTSFGLPAKVEGSATNLMQQSKTLEFVEIKEQGATYYLAPLLHTNEEVMNFTIDITPAGESEPHRLEFTRKLYNN